MGVSGGVDSSVAALLLKKRGYQVTAAFLSVWQPDFLECTRKDDRRDALRVAAALNIPFVEIDAVEEYRREVIAYLLREYQSGRTPNPDVMCNKHIKFGIFLKKARAMGADAIATGHYARLAQRGGKWALLRAKDDHKDQTYFLWTLSQEQLAHALFPIGEYRKDEVRRIARAHQLFTAAKRDSQGLCFIGKMRMREFLSHLVGPQERGLVLNEKGEVIGEHPGALFFTIGQRRGFTITKKTPHDVPYYVVAKDMARNTLTVSQAPRQYPHGAGPLTLEQPHWIRRPLAAGEQCMARLRHRQPLFPVTIQSAEKEEARVMPEQALGPVPHGQSLVLYQGDECLGGGILA